MTLLNKVLNRLDRPNRVWFGISASLVLVIAGLVISLFAVSRANDSNTLAHSAQRFAQADCGTWHDLAVIPPSAGATESGLRLWAGFRDSYINKGCESITGVLPAPDKRLLPYLKTH